MKNKKLLSILLAGAMIGTAPASAWAADFTDVNIVAEENAAEDTTEDVTEEAPEQQEADAAEDTDSDALVEDAEDLTEEADAEELDQSAEAFVQEEGDALSDGEAAAAFDDGETAGDLTLKGTGTEADPYQITSTDDIQAVANYVNSGKGTFSGQYLKFTEDITLPTNWTPIGTNASKFAGIIDGDGHLLTVPAGEKCLLGYTSKAELNNLNVYGEKIASDGIVANYEVGTTISFNNVTLKSGTQTLKSGFLGGYASGSNAINITNCTVEKGVVIGYDKDQKNIGSFGGDFNGTVQNCVSYADVYGVDYVGGICGNKGQSMGTYALKDCQFYGTVTAAGNYAGGISGGGYGGTRWGVNTAPNTPGVTIQNCYSNGTITGNNYVGGILGAETGMVQCWSNGIEYIQNNKFEGNVSAADGSYVGGVVGYINGLDKYNIIENNEYTCKNVKGIGFIKYIDTNYANPTAIEGVTYYSSENGRPSISGATKAQHNRTDDPLGADADKLAKLVAKKINVGLTILGDELHDTEQDHTYHTYYAGNLETWLEQSEYTVVEGSTVKDVIDAALLANNMTCSNPSGNYIESVTKGDVTLGEFSNNSKKSGWMYTLNGVYPELGVSQQTVNNGDQIVFHYTDWYGEEEKHVWETTWTSDETAHWHECENSKGEDAWCDISSNDRKDGYAAHTFDEGKVTKEATCKEAGVKTYTCTVCGATKTEGIPALPHTYDEGKVTKEATCKAKGVKTYTCKECGATKTEAIAVNPKNHSWDEGKVTKAATCTETGVKTYTCKACGATKTETIEKTTHTYTWKTTTKATVFKPAVQTKVCSKCGYKTKTTRNYGKKLTPTLKLTATKINLKVKQSTSKVKATGFANGDAVKSWTSSNKSVATVSSKGVIKAGSKAGKAKITVTLKSGKKGYITVTVQKTAVKTTKISGVKSALTLNKGKKTTLKPVISPITSVEKITYTTSNKNVATVSSTGVITAKKKGTAVITVKSGSKKVTCKVTVK